MSDPGVEFDSIDESYSESDSANSGGNFDGPRICGSCDALIVGEGYKCQRCHDFHYCRKCLQDVGKIHPGHNFISIILGSPEEAPVKEGGYEYFDEFRGKSLGTLEAPEGQCRSCFHITHGLPLLHFAQKKKSHRSKVTQVSLLWEVKISRLVEATQRGCLFCMFFLEKVFVNVKLEALDSYRLDRLQEKGIRDVHEQIEIIEQAMELLSLQKHDRFVFTALPICRKGKTRLPEFDKLRFICVNKLGPMDHLRVFGQFKDLEWEMDIYADAGSNSSHFD
jgi:hypothetical protein